MQAISYGFSLPASAEEGQISLLPQVGQAYIYLNAGWQSFSGVPIYDFEVNHIVTINDEDISSYVINRSLKLNNILSSKTDTCSFIVEDLSHTLDIAEGMEIEIWYRLALGDTFDLIFGGEVNKCPKSELASGQTTFEYAVSGTDFRKRLNRKLAIETYSAEYAGDIIKDLIDSYYAGEFTYDDVLTGDLITTISFNYKPVADCIAELAKLIGYDWYVDYNKGIHFFSSDTNAAPYQLDETSVTGHYKDLKIAVDKSQLRNRIFIRGGYYSSNLYTDEQVADGKATGFLLQYPPKSPITVYVGGIAKTCGIDNIDTTGFDFVVNYKEKLIKNLDLATLGATTVLKVTYTYDIEVLTQDDDFTSQAAVAAVEENDGIYEFVITDDTINSLQLAHDRAWSELNRYSSAVISGSFLTDQYGYQAGQLLTLDMPTWEYQKDYLIQKVTAQMRNDGKLFYNISFATSTKGLTEFLKALWEQGTKVIVRENETIHDLGVFTESMVLSETIDYTTEHISTYVYNNATSMWNLAEWS